jgi:hypothetical protein
MDLTPKSIFGQILSRLSQLTNDAGFADAGMINNTIVPRYAKQHATPAGTPDSLTVTWPVGRFTSVPIMPDPTVVITDANFLYKAQVTSCTMTGCTIKITRQAVALSISLGALTLNPPVTASVQVNVFAIQQTD